MPGRASDPPRSRDVEGGVYRIFRGDLIGYLGFRHRGLLIGEEVRLEGHPGGCTPQAWGGPTRAARGCVSLAPCPLGEILTLAFVPSNSENISLLAFLKPKTAENRQLALRHLVNRLVPENI